MKKWGLLFILLLTAYSTCYAQSGSPLSGDWKGFITIQGNQLVIETHFQQHDDKLSGTIDIQGATLPLQNISVRADSVFFDFTTSINVAKFKGAFHDDSTISGQYHQAGQQFPFELDRYELEAETDTTKAQTKAPLPYNHEDLIIKNDSIDIAGTLTWPQKGEPNQLVIIISGSGAQDRNGSLPITDFKPYAALADSLTRRGIATFRYDDRGVGQSTGSFSNATLDTLASDVDTIITEFTDGTGQDFDEIILLGHSQGGVVAGKVAAKNDHQVDKLILMASTGVPLADVSNFQVRQALEQSGFSKSQIKSEMAARQQLYDAVQSQRGIEKARKQHTQQFFTSIRDVVGSQQDSTTLRQIAQRETQNLVSWYTNPQTLSLYSYDPTTDFKKLDIPVMVLFGGKDTQVTTEMNQGPIEQALDQSGITHRTKVFDDANHLFQKAETGQAQEYGSLDSAFVDGFIKEIVQWIDEN